MALSPPLIRIEPAMALHDKENQGKSAKHRRRKHCDQTRDFHWVSINPKRLPL